MLNRTQTRSGHQAAIYDLQLAPDGFFSAAADGYLVHWHREDVDFGRVVAKVEGGKFLCLATLPDGGLVAGALDGGVHWLYPEETTRNRHIAHHAKGVFDVIRIEEEVFTVGGDGILTRWSVKEQRSLESLPLSANSLRCLAYSAEHDTLAIGASDGQVYLVGRKDFDLIGQHRANEPSVFCVAFQPGFPRIVSGGRDAQLRFFELASSRTPPSEITAHLSTVNDLAFDPTGRYLATASRDKTVKLWETATWSLLKVAEVVRDRGHVNSVNTLLWLDEQTLITAGDDRRILEWQVGAAAGAH